MEQFAAASSWINDRLVIAIAALLINAALMGPRSFIRRLRLDRPARFVTRALRTMERKLNRAKRSADDRAFRGMTMVVIFVAAAAAAGGALSFLLSFSYYGSVIQILLLAYLLCQRQQSDLAYAVASAVEAENAPKARAELEGTAWRNAALLDTHGLARAVIETGAVGFTEKVVSPVLWYVLLGLPGLLATRIVTALGDAAGEPRDAFGGSIAKAGWLVHYVPSLIAGILMCLASMFLPFCSPVKALQAWILAGFAYIHHRSQITVIGAALNIALGGPISVYAPGVWTGGAVARAHARDVRRSQLLLWVAAFLLLFMLAAVLA